MKLNTGMYVCKQDGTDKTNVFMNGNILKPADAVIGIFTVSLGIGYMLFKAFKNGGTAFDKGECEALTKIGCM